MAQFARPSLDITTGWATTPLWSKIDEVTPDDGDYITGTGPSVTAEVKLSAVTDPLDDTNHAWSFRTNSAGSGGPERLNVDLYQGTTLIEQLILNQALTRSWALWQGTLVNAANITDYSDLRFRLVTGANGAAETVDVSWMELSIPDAASAPVEESAALAIFKGATSVTYAGAPAILSLAKSVGQSAAELGNLQEIVAQDRINTVAPSSLISGEEVVSLNRVGAIAPSEFGIFDESISLARAKGLSVLEDFTTTIQEAASLSRLLGVASEAQEQSAENVNLAKVAAVTIGTQLVAYSATSLNRINTIPANTLGTLYDLINLSHLNVLTVLEETQGQTNETVILNRLLGVLSESQEQSYEDLDLAYILSTISESQEISGQAISLGAVHGLNVLEETQGSIEEAVTLTRLMALTSYSQENSNQSVALNSLYGIGAAEQAVGISTVVLSSNRGLSTVEFPEISELISLAKVHTISLADNVTVLDAVNLLVSLLITADPSSIYEISRIHENNVFYVKYRDKRYRVIFRDKRG